MRAVSESCVRYAVVVKTAVMQSAFSETILNYSLRGA